MSVYYVNKLFYKLETDKAYLDRFRADPKAVLVELKLTDEERDAILAGDVGKLYVMGAHGFLMNTLSRQNLLGVSRDNYVQRVKAAVAAQNKT